MKEFALSVLAVIVALIVVKKFGATVGLSA